jgi:hypothetical protein
MVVFPGLRRQSHIRRFKGVRATLRRRVDTNLSLLFTIRSQNLPSIQVLPLVVEHSENGESIAVRKASSQP